MCFSEANQTLLCVASVGRGEMDVQSAAAACERVIDSVNEAVILDDGFLQNAVTAVIANGHILLEDVPGTGKTLTARSLASALGLSFSRIQFTPDMLPADITGSSVFNEQTREFQFNRGPLFANIVLADEINRAPPKTQAALLEAMEEGQVSVDGDTHDLPDPFIVLATQNPVEQEGTFPLPEAQVDRFWIKESIGMPDREGEVMILNRRADRTTGAPSVEPVLDPTKMMSIQAVPESITVDRDLRYYLTDICRETRTNSRVEAGVSPRGTQRLFELVRARALLAGRDYVTPEDIQTMAPAALAHRLVLTPKSRVAGTDKRSIIENIVNQVEVPGVDDIEA